MPANTSITSRAFARAGLLGNPSDGYHGKAIGFPVRDFCAMVSVDSSPLLRINPSSDDLRVEFASLKEFSSNVDNFGYYGGVRLIKASIKRFYTWCTERIELPQSNFSIQYHTNIPRSVGLAGSSAIITATFKALCGFYRVEIPSDVQASLVLSTEKDLLGISAGLMDRVVQSIEDVVFMDFSSQSMHQKDGVDVGKYQLLEPSECEGHLFLAWASNAAEPTEVLHNRLQARFLNGDPEVVDAMNKFADFAERGRLALQSNDFKELGALIDANFDLRASICRLPRFHKKMVEVARQNGGTAKFCGSGGAIVGTVPDDPTFARVSDGLKQIGCEVIRPQIRSTAVKPRSH